MSPEDKKIVVEVWKSILDVQMHFNDIELKIRSLFVTLLLALCAAIGFLEKESLKLVYGNLNIPYVTIIPVLGLVGSWLFYFMDRHWYHRLLVGSVNQAIEIEKRYQVDMPDLGLSAAIGKASPVKFQNPMFRVLCALIVTEEKYKQTKTLHSDGKIEFFYKSVMMLFLSLFLVLAFSSHGISIGKQSLADYVAAHFPKIENKQDVVKKRKQIQRKISSDKSN